MRSRRVGALLVALLIASPAAAQSTSQASALFIAVKEHDAAKLIELVTANGAGFVNSRDFDGSTALTLAVKNRSRDFALYLIEHGADANMQGLNGEPPLVVAARQGWNEGIDDLLTVGARPDATNRQGETALIIAVQLRNVIAVRHLLAVHANPDKTDNAAGLSARDYAKRDNRARDILNLMQQSKPAPKS